MSDLTAKDILPQGVSMDVNLPDRSLDGQPISSAKSISAPGVEGKCSDLVDSGSALLSDVTLEQGEGYDTSNMKGELPPIFDIKHTGVEDKFVNSILHVSQFKSCENSDKVNIEIYNAWCRQSNFGFVPFSEQLLPDTDVINETIGKCPLTIHEIVRATRKPNFMQARFPVDSQLKIEAWKNYLQGYWDRQLIQLIQLAFL